MPIRPAFEAGRANPCYTDAGKEVCLPAVHVVSGWHMFSDESLNWMKAVPELESRPGGCFDDWGEDDKNSRQWIGQFGKAPPPSTMILTHCNKLLTWYPAFAGRYTSAWGKAYGPCKARESAKPGDYYANAMWQVCRPAALAAHDAAMGVGGAGHEATPPFVMKALYGPRVKVISALRNPVDRLETSFWSHRHYPAKYGANPHGFQRYIEEQGGAFENCAAKHGARRCAYLFELLGPEQGEVFFHCDQIIRGLYEPFVRDWHAALGAESLLVLKVESLLDAPAAARGRILGFLGLGRAASGGAADVGVAATTGYRQLHAQSLHEARAQPMLNATRALAEAFYRPHNEALGLLLGWPKSEAWPHSTAIDAEGIASAAPPAGKGRASRTRRTLREQKRRG